MQRLATFFLAASALVPAATVAQTVRPQDQYEGTPRLALSQPAPRPAPMSAPAPIARPIAPTPPTPPAGITWRNQAAPAPTFGKNMPPPPAARPAPAQVQAPPPPPPPPPVLAAPSRPAPPPPVAAEPARRFERIVIQRRPGGAAPAGARDILIRRPGGPGPVGTREFEIIEEPGVAIHGNPPRVFVQRSPEPYSDEGGYDDTGEMVHEDGYIEGEGYPGAYGHPGHPQPGYPHSGGMIVETIVTTTTYPDTVQRRAAPRGRRR